MKDFTFYAPTEVVFGRDGEQQVAALVKKYGGSKVLLHYGGESARRSGLLDLVKSRLEQAGIDYVELGGVVPNPRLSKAYEGIDLCRKHGVDFILAVGGGSVIDSAKVIAYGVKYDGDVWDVYEGICSPTEALPVATVLTIPAAGSEMSDSAVITKDEGEIKRGYSNPISRCKFAIMNPERTYTLPAWQTSAGVADMLMHTMERYFSLDDDMLLTDAIAEALMRNVMECAVKVLRAPEDYQLRAQIMWAGSLAHNDLTGCGTTGDWATHEIEHELSALFGVTHGAGLAAIFPYWARYTMHCNMPRFAQFAVNVLGVPNDFHDAEKTALEGIEAMKEFYRKIGMPTNIPELIGRPATEEEIQLMAKKATRGGTITLGNLMTLAQEDIANIYRLANG